MCYNPSFLSKCKVASGEKRMSANAQSGTYDLDALLEHLREKITEIVANPDSAYERIVARKLGETGCSVLRGAPGPAPSIEEVERELGVSDSPTRYRYAMKGTGSLLLNLQRVVTRSQLDEKADRVRAFKA